MVPPAEFESYYGRPVLKPPVWEWKIAAYLFTGGLSAGSAVLGAGADLTGRRTLRRVGWLSALVNRNRLRFVVKTFPAERIWGEFVAAERARLSVVSQGMEARMLRRAYLEGILRSAEWIAARMHYYLVVPEEARRLGGLCVGLRRDLAAFERGR